MRHCWLCSQGDRRPHRCGRGWHPMVLAGTRPKATPRAGRRRSPGTGGSGLRSPRHSGWRRNPVPEQGVSHAGPARMTRRSRRSTRRGRHVSPIEGRRCRATSVGPCGRSAVDNACWHTLKIMKCCFSSAAGAVSAVTRALCVPPTMICWSRLWSCGSQGASHL